MSTCTSFHSSMLIAHLNGEIFPGFTSLGAWGFISEVSLVWLDQTEGMQVFNSCGSMPTVFHVCVCWLQLEFRDLLLEVHLLKDDTQAYLPQLQSIHNNTFRVFQFVRIYTNISHDVAAHLLALS